VRPTYSYLNLLLIIKHKTLKKVCIKIGLPFELCKWKIGFPSPEILYLSLPRIVQSRPKVLKGIMTLMKETSFSELTGELRYFLALKWTVNCNHSFIQRDFKFRFRFNWKRRTHRAVQGRNIYAVLHWYARKDVNTTHGMQGEHDNIM